MELVFIHRIRIIERQTKHTVSTSIALNRYR
jgi:hypothetical protein